MSVMSSIKITRSKADEIIDRYLASVEDDDDRKKEFVNFILGEDDGFHNVYKIVENGSNEGEDWRLE